MTLPLWLPVLIPVLVAAGGYFSARRFFYYVQLLFQLAQVAIVTSFLVSVVSGGPTITVLGGLTRGVGIALKLDSISAPFIALTGWFFLMLQLFNFHKKYMNRLFLFLLGILQGLLIGIFLSGDLFNMYVLLELSTLVVAILIMYKRDKQAIYNGMIYMTVNLAGMTFVLLGIGFVYRTYGTLDLDQIAALVAQQSNLRSAILPYAFVMTGIGVKAAVVLGYGWLPPAHGAPSAPSIVSAVLSGLQVKAGVFLFIRYQSVFAEALGTDALFLVLGVITAVSGFLFAIAQRDVKLILAYHTVSQLGLIMVGLSAGTETAWWGALYHMVNHALFKGLLFLTAGLVIHVYETRSVYEIRGVFRRMPFIGIAMFAGVLGITGAPYFNGSVSKYLIQSGWTAPIGEYLVLLINLGTAISFVKFSTMLFGRSTAPEHQAVAALGESEPEEGSVPVVVDESLATAEVEDASAAGQGDRDPVPQVVHSAQPDAFTRTIAVVIGLACLAGGVAAAQILPLIFPVAPSVAGAYYLRKFLTFGATVAVGAAIYFLVIKRTKLFDRLRAVRVRLMDLSLGVFGLFSLMTVYLTITVR